MYHNILILILHQFCQVLLKQNLNGQYDLMKRRLYAYLMEKGYGTKHSDGIMDEILLDIMEYCNDEKDFLIPYKWVVQPSIIIRKWH